MSAKQNVGLMALVTTSSQPKNVLEIIMAPNGYAELQQIGEERKDIDGVLRIYHWEADLATEIGSTFEKHATDQGGKMIWMCASVDGLFFDLDNQLMVYRPEAG